MKNGGRIVFVFAEIILYGMSLAGKAAYLDEVRYTGIVFCFAYAFLCICATKKWKRKESIALAGLFFTCIADYFLVIRNAFFAVGVALFLVTQCFYFFYLTSCSPKIQKVKRISQRGLIAVVLFLFASVPMKERIPFLFLLLLVFYLVLFVGNIVLGIQQFQETGVFAIGLVLFFCCDICVGLTNVHLFVSDLPHYKISAWLIWFFYLPSQVCITYGISKNKT